MTTTTLSPSPRTDADRPIAFNRARPWSERAALGGVLATVALVTLWLGPVSAVVAAGVLALWLASVPIAALMRASFLLRNSVQISPITCPDWHASLQAVQHRFGLPEWALPRLMLQQDPMLNAYATYWPGRPLLSVTSGLADRLSGPEDEPLRRAVLGHEIAHARWHMPWFLWTDGPDPTGSGDRLRGGAGLFAAFNVLMVFVTLAWSRRAVQAADRGALLAAGSLEAVATALATISSGVRPASLEALREQRELQRRTLTGRLEGLGALLSTHPLLWDRIAAVVDFACSNTYRRIVGPELAEQALWDSARLGFRPDRAAVGR